MSNKFFYQYRTVTLANGDRLAVQTNAKFLNILENTGSDIKVEINEEPEQTLPKGIGLIIGDGEDLTRLTLINDTGASLTLTYSLSNSLVQDNRTVVSGSLSTTPAGDTLTTAADNTVSTIETLSAANSQRKEIIVQLISGSPCRVGDANITTTRGHRLANAGDSVVLSTEAAVSCVSEGASSVVAVVESTKA